MGFTQREEKIVSSLTIKHMMTQDCYPRQLCRLMLLYGICNLLITFDFPTACKHVFLVTTWCVHAVKEGGFGRQQSTLGDLH